MREIDLLLDKNINNIEPGKVLDVYDDVKPEWLIIPGQYDAHSNH